jgi:hypothetical protein
MSTNLLRLLVTALAGGLTAVGQSGVLPIPPEVFIGLSGTLIGWLLPQLGKKEPAPRAPSYDGKH